MEEEERERKAKRQERIDSVMKVTLPRQGCPAGLQLWWGVNIWCGVHCCTPPSSTLERVRKEGVHILPFRAQYSTETKVRARARAALLKWFSPRSADAGLTQTRTSAARHVACTVSAPPRHFTAFSPVSFFGCAFPENPTGASVSRACLYSGVTWEKAERTSSVLIFFLRCLVSRSLSSGFCLPLCCSQRCVCLFQAKEATEGDPDAGSIPQIVADRMLSRMVREGIDGPMASGRRGRKRTPPRTCFRRCDDVCVGSVGTGAMMAIPT